MKLYKVPRGSKIRLKCEANEHPSDHRDFKSKEELYFSHVDGMYSYCKDKNGKVVHLAAWTDVEVIE